MCRYRKIISDDEKLFPSPPDKVQNALLFLNQSNLQTIVLFYFTNDPKRCHVSNYVTSNVVASPQIKRVWFGIIRLRLYTQSTYGTSPCLSCYCRNDTVASIANKQRKICICKYPPHPDRTSFFVMPRRFENMVQDIV